MPPEIDVRINFPPVKFCLPRNNRLENTVRQIRCLAHRPAAHLLVAARRVIWLILANCLYFVPFRAKLFYQAAKILHQFLHLRWHFAQTGNVDCVRQSDFVDLTGDDTVPESVEIAAVPTGSTNSAEEGVIKVIGRLPVASIKLKFRHAIYRSKQGGFPEVRC